MPKLSLKNKQIKNNNNNTSTLLQRRKVEFIKPLKTRLLFVSLSSVHQIFTSSIFQIELWRLRGTTFAEDKCVLVYTLGCSQDIPVMRCYLNTALKAPIIPNLTDPLPTPFSSLSIDHATKHTEVMFQEETTREEAPWYKTLTTLNHTVNCGDFLIANQCYHAHSQTAMLTL